MIRYSSKTPVILFFLLLCSFVCFSQNQQELLPPPVDIVFDISPLHPDNSVNVTIHVSARDICHARVMVFLPYGVGILPKDRPRCRPYSAMDFRNKGSVTYRYCINLYTGVLAQGEAKEFSFTVIAEEQKQYPIACAVDALSKWGYKQEIAYIGSD